MNAIGLAWAIDSIELSAFIHFAPQDVAEGRQKQATDFERFFAGASSDRVADPRQKRFRGGWHELGNIYKALFRKGILGVARALH